MTAVATGRDLLTGTDGVARVVAEARVDATIDYFDGRQVTAISSDPPLPGLDTLVGLPTARGFRRALDQALPGEAGSHSVSYQLLDDLPTALLVSGFALSVAGVTFSRRPEHASAQFPDLCAGWAEGGTIVSTIRRAGEVPVVTGPPAPSLVGLPSPSDPSGTSGPVDPLAWHRLGPLGPHDMRRLRRIDVWMEEGAGAGSGEVHVDAFFRDSHMDPEGRETVVHEYGLAATLDPETSVFTSCRATIGALPWRECPGALASAGRLAGRSAGGLRALVRQELVGPSTCTHLNDMLRALEDVPALAEAIGRG